MRVLVTGASGFIGTEVTRGLLERGWCVRGLVRSPDSRLRAGVERALVPTFHDRGQLRPAMQGVDVVVHLAGRAHMTGSAADDLEAFRDANVETTASLLHVAEAAGARLFVYLSTMAVFGEARADPLDENAVPAPSTPYGRSKLEAERLVRAAARDRMQTVVVRPPMVYGPGMKGNPHRLFRWIYQGKVLPFGALTNRRSILYSGNLTAALTRIIECGGVRSDVYHLADPSPLAMRELVEWIATGLGTRARMLSPSPRLLNGAARLIDTLPAPLRFGASGADLQRVMHDFVVDAGRITRILGFVPPFGTPEGIAVTAEWFRDAERSIPDRRNA